jgi:hypothetical protein
LPEELEKAKWKFPPNRIFNFDETHRKCCLGPPKVLAENGSEAVKLKTGKGEKESGTGYRCISAAREKFPFGIIAKAKTVLSQAKLNVPPDMIVQQTSSRWTNKQMTRISLEWLSTQVNDEPILLVLDVYPAHRMFPLLQRVRELGIQLLFVPAGGTSRFQPLER